MRRAVPFLLAVISASIVVSACGGSSANTDWKTGKDVLDGLKAAGFECPWSGSGDQVLTENPLTGEKSDYPTVQCDGFAVSLVGSRDELVKKLGENCQPLTSEDVASSDSSIQLVVGERFVIAGTGDGAAFPGVAQPADFTKAFGGEVMTVLDLYKLACPDQPVPSVSAGATGETSEQKAAVESDIRNIATAMETYYTQNGAYPSDVSQLTTAGATLSDGNDAAVTLTDGGNGYRIVGCNATAQQIHEYYSMGGGFVDATATSCPSGGLTLQ